MSTITAPEWLSPSSLEKYENCPLSYRMLAIEKLPDAPGEAAIVGIFVHEVLEHLIGRDPAERTLDVARQLATQRFAAFHTTAEFTGLGLDASGIAAFKQKAWQMVEGYFAIEDPADVAAEGTETWVRGAIGGARVRGIIDRLDRCDDALVIADYKTGKPPSARYAKERFKAMTIYATLYEATTGERPRDLRLLYLAGPIEHVEPVTDRALGACADRVARLWDGIQRDCERGEFQARPGKLCDWCANKPYCPAFGGSLTEGLEIARSSRSQWRR